MYAHQLLLSCHVFFSCLILALKKIKFMCVLCIYNYIYIYVTMLAGFSFNGRCKQKYFQDQFLDGIPE